MLIKCWWCSVHCICLFFNDMQAIAIIAPLSPGKGEFYVTRKICLLSILETRHLPDCQDPSQGWKSINILIHLSLLVTVHYSSQFMKSYMPVFERHMQSIFCFILYPQSSYNNAIFIHLKLTILGKKH